MARRGRRGRARGGQSGNSIGMTNTMSILNLGPGPFVNPATDDFIPLVKTSPKFAAKVSPIKTLRVTRTSGGRTTTLVDRPSSVISTPRKESPRKPVSPSKVRQSPKGSQPQLSPNMRRTSMNENDKRVLRSSSRGRGEPESKRKKISETVSVPVSHADVIDLAISEESNPSPKTSPNKSNRTCGVSLQAARGDSNQKLYVVIDGHEPGIYKSAIEAWEHIDGYNKSFVKTFNNQADANFFLQTYRNMQSSTITQSTVINTNDSMPGKSSGRNSSSYNFQPSCNGVFGTSKGHADIYTDGSYETRTQTAGIGVYWGPNDPRNVSEPLEGFTSSTRAEVCAAIRAIRDAKAQGYSSVALHTDSQVMINSIRQWVDDYINKRKRKKVDGVNERDLLDLVEAITGLAITWVKVKGHSGVIGNEAADKLAKAGRDEALKLAARKLVTAPAGAGNGRRVANRRPNRPTAPIVPISCNRVPTPDTFWHSVYDPMMLNPVAPRYPFGY